MYLGGIGGHSSGSKVWHGMGGSAHICICFFYYLKVTYEIGEQLELQAVFLCVSYRWHQASCGAGCFDGLPFVSVLVRGCTELIGSLESKLTTK